MMMRTKLCIFVMILIGGILSGCGLSQTKLDKTPTQMVRNTIASQTTQVPSVTRTISRSPTFMATATVAPTLASMPTIMTKSESTPTLPDVVVDPASQPPPAGYKAYNSPYWLSIYYPEDWVQVYDELPGDILLATEYYGIYSGEEAEAAFQIFPAGQGDLEPVLDEIFSQLAGSNSNVEVLEKPHSLEVNGQPAVSALVSYPKNETRLNLEWITVIQGYDRVALTLAYCPAERQDLYKPVFDQMLNSLILRRGPPNPVVGERTAYPEYVSYTNDWEGFNLSYPPDRTAEMVGDILIVSPLGESWQEQIFGRLEVMVFDDLDNKLGNPGDQPDEILSWFIDMLGYMSSTLHDAVVVTDVVEVEREDQEIARALISGSVDGEPVLAMVTVIQYKRRVGLAIAFGRNLAELSEEGRIIDTLVITNPLRTGGITLVPGKEYTGTIKSAQKMNFTFPCRVDAPLALILETPGNEADMELFDASGSAVSYSGSIASQDLRLEKPAVMLLEPETDGLCALTVIDRSNIGAYTFKLKMIDIQHVSSALLETMDGDLAVSEVDQVKFQAKAGERLILAAHTTGDDCVNLSMEIYDEEGQEREEYFSSISDSCKNRAQAYSFIREQAGTYTLRIKGDPGQAIAYRLYILRDD